MVINILEVVKLNYFMIFLFFGVKCRMVGIYVGLIKIQVIGKLNLMWQWKFLMSEFFMYEIILVIMEIYFQGGN